MTGFCKECGNVLPNHRATCSIGQRHASELARVKSTQWSARYWYDATRGSQAFNIPKEDANTGPQGYVTRRANGAAVWYEFRDGSILTVLHARNAIQWAPGWAALSPMNASRLPLAIRTLWESR